MKYTAADHDTVNTGFTNKLMAVLYISHITISYQQCLRRYRISKGFYLWH